MKRVLLVLVAFAALWAATAQTPVATAQAPATAPHDGSASCVHCHEDPHAGTAKVGCVECHTTEAFAPSTFDLPRHAATGFPLEGKHATVACTSCHVKGKLTGQPRECAGCHVDRHRGLLGDDCASCHTVAGFEAPPDFDHARTGFVLTGAHSALSCSDCHAGAHKEALMLGGGGACSTCHERTHADFGPCATCHQDAHTSFAQARASFDHRFTGFPLERRHGAQACVACHPAAGPAPQAECGTCHEDPHSAQLGTACETCHRADRFSLARFDHDLTGWPLRGRHFVTPCAECHTAQRWIGLTSDCFDCHALDVSPGTVPAHDPARTECSDCHTTWQW